MASSDGGAIDGTAESNESLRARPTSEFEDSYHDKLEVRGALLSEPLSSVRQRPLLQVESTRSVASVITAMIEQNLGYALVVKDGRLVGIFTERDVLRKVALSDVALDNVSVESVMTPDPDTLPATASIDFALRKMDLEGYRHIPLVDPEGKPVGLIAVRDIVHWMVDLFPGKVYNLPPEPGVPGRLDGG